MVRGGRKKGIKGASFNVEEDSNEYNDETWIKEREQEDAEPLSLIHISEPTRRS